MKKIKVGFVPLCDAAPLIVARALGAYARRRLAVELVALRSWADVRDRLIVGEIHAAHCLAGIPLGAQAGLFGPQAPLATAFTLNHYGNAITLARPLAEILGDGPRRFVDYARRRRDEGQPLVLASVFPLSKHEYELRHWVAQLGLDPVADVRFVVVPPRETARALRRGRIDGYCVGEPWNTSAVLDGCGVTVATSAASGLPGTEKVLAVREDFLEREEHAALLHALADAGAWLADGAHREAAVELVAPYVGRPLEELRPALANSFPRGAAAPAEDDFVRFDTPVNRPDREHARWYLAQMQRAGQVDAQAPTDEICARAFRSDLYEVLLRQS